MNELKNDLFLRALRAQELQRPPVWMMRQAGRYLPEYRALRDKYDFFTRVETPELACEITLQPIDIIGPDAAIIFSDILVIPQAMGLEVLMEEGKGPLLPVTVSSEQDVEKLQTEGAGERLHYVCDAIRLTKKELNGRVPLIGFAGAPFTILCYMVEGKGSKSFDKTRSFMATRPALAEKLLGKITEATIDYLHAQVDAGADAIQVFDSWSGLLSPEDFSRSAQPWLEAITKSLSPRVPVILFPKGSWYALESLSYSGASALGVDWCTPAHLARQWTGKRVSIQGNFDPAKLLLPIPQLQEEVRKMIRSFGTHRYIANLGHGILPHIPVDHARAFVDAVKSFEG